MPIYLGNPIYHLVEATRYNISPVRSTIRAFYEFYSNSFNPLSYTRFGKTMRASLDIAERITRHYKKPEWRIKEVKVDGITCSVKKETIVKKPFCHLQHFKKAGSYNHPKLLIVAPLAGHHATLLRGTIEDLLPYFDIYVTDWVDACMVPLSKGTFDMDDYIDYLIEFLNFLGKNTHIMGVCQPTVPVLAATALMSADKNPNAPKSMILIGGPVDARKSPTAVNVFATGKSLEWFQQYLITTVPENYPGHGRQVYPGFMQLAGFLSMNMHKHIDSHIKLFKNLLVEEDAEAEKQKLFYDEYLSVLDLPAEFYLQTVKEVFQDFSLATGKLVSRNRQVDLSAIKHTALLGIEGEKDDIAGVGQTKASLTLCKNIPESKKYYHLQKDVGHYGVFSGSKFRQEIVPVIKNFVYKFNS